MKKKDSQENIENNKEEKTDIKEKILEYVKSIVVAGIIYLVISTTVIKATQIYSGSMEKTLQVGDFLFINKFIYGIKIPYTDIRLPELKDPKPGDIIVFKYPKDESINYVKRCIAVEGQTVEIKNKVVYVDGKPFPNPEGVKFEGSEYPEGYIESDIFPAGNGNRDNYGPVTVPPGYLFMMGDNRDNSFDSRYWGFMPRKNIVGKPIIIYWSWRKNLPLWKFFSKVRWLRIGDIPK